MRLRRMIAPLAAGILLAAAACSPDGEGEDSEGVSEGTLVLGTGSVGGTYYPLGGAMAQMWANEIDRISVSTIATGASVENLALLNRGEIELAMAVNGTATQAINGEGDFEGVDMDFAFAGNIYPEVMQIVATEGSGIETVADLDGARVSIGPDGSATQILANEIMQAAGVEPDTTFSDGFGDAGDRLRDGQVDAAFGILALPDATLTEVAQNTDVRVVTIPDDIREQLESADETLSSIDVPGGTYPGVDDDAVTLTSWASLYVPTDMDDDLVYDLVQALYEQTDGIDHAVAASINIDTAVEGVIDVDIHPGARRYFEEAGVL